MVGACRPGRHMRGSGSPTYSGSLEAFGAPKLPLPRGSGRRIRSSEPLLKLRKGLEGLGSALSTDQILFYSHENSVVEAAAKAAGITQPVNRLVAYAVGPAPKKAKTAVAGPGAGEVTLVTNGPTPAKAAAFTNAYAKALGDYINGLVSSKQQAQLQQVQSTVNKLKFEIAASGSKAPASLTSQLSTAQADEQTLIATPVTTGYQVLRSATASAAVSSGGGKASPTSSKKVRLLGGFVVGLIIGAGIVLILALLDKRLRDSSRAANHFGFPIVAEIPLPSKMNGQCDVSALSLRNAWDSPVAEAYQMLRMAVVLEDLAGELVYDAGPEAQQLGSTAIGIAHSDGAAPTGFSADQYSSGRFGGLSWRRNCQTRGCGQPGCVLRPCGPTGSCDEHSGYPIERGRWSGQGPRTGRYFGESCGSRAGDPCRERFVSVVERVCSE